VTPLENPKNVPLHFGGIGMPLKKKIITKQKIKF
jgi:hypothetical protein